MVQASKTVPKQKIVCRKVSPKKKTKKMKTRDFLKTYEAIYEEGPKVRYKDPDAWIRSPGTSNRTSRLP